MSAPRIPATDLFDVSMLSGTMPSRGGIESPASPNAATGRVGGGTASPRNAAATASYSPEATFKSTASISAPGSARGNPGAATLAASPLHTSRTGSIYFGAGVPLDPELQEATDRLKKWDARAAALRAHHEQALLLVGLCRRERDRRQHHLDGPILRAFKEMTDSIFPLGAAEALMRASMAAAGATVPSPPSVAVPPVQAVTSSSSPPGPGISGAGAVTSARAVKPTTVTNETTAGPSPRPPLAPAPSVASGRRGNVAGDKKAKLPHHDETAVFSQPLAEPAPRPPLANPLAGGVPTPRQGTGRNGEMATGVARGLLPTLGPSPHLATDASSARYAMFQKATSSLSPRRGRSGSAVSARSVSLSLRNPHEPSAAQVAEEERRRAKVLAAVFAAYMKKRRAGGGGFGSSSSRADFTVGGTGAGHRRGSGSGGMNGSGSATGGGGAGALSPLALMQHLLDAYNEAHGITKGDARRRRLSSKIRRTNGGASASARGSGVADTLLLDASLELTFAGGESMSFVGDHEAGACALRGASFRGKLPTAVAAGKAVSSSSDRVGGKTVGGSTTAIGGSTLNLTALHPTSTLSLTAQADLSAAATGAAAEGITRVPEVDEGIWERLMRLRDERLDNEEVLDAAKKAVESSVGRVDSLASLLAVAEYSLDAARRDVQSIHQRRLPPAAVAPPDVTTLPALSARGGSKGGARRGTMRRGTSVGATGRAAAGLPAI